MRSMRVLVFASALSSAAFGDPSHIVGSWNVILTVTHSSSNYSGPSTFTQVLLVNNVAVPATSPDNSSIQAAAESIAGEPVAGWVSSPSWGIWEQMYVVDPSYASTDNIGFVFVAAMAQNGSPAGMKKLRMRVQVNSNNNGFAGFFEIDVFDNAKNLVSSASGSVQGQPLTISINSDAGALPAIPPLDVTPPAAAPSFTANGVVNAASFVSGGVVQGEMATIFGANLTSSSGVKLTSVFPLPVDFMNVSVTVNGTPAPLFAVDNVNGQQQINFQVPWEVASYSTANIQILNTGTASPSVVVPVLSAQPAIFNYNVGGNTFGAIRHADYQLADTSHPAEGGETVLIYCTGIGAAEQLPQDGAAATGETTIATPVVTIGGVTAPVSFSGLAPGFVGLNQINAEVPTGLAAKNQLVIVTVGSASSNSVLLPVQ